MSAHGSAPLRGAGIAGCIPGTMPAPLRFTDRPAFRLAGLRRTHALGDPAASIAAQWRDFRDLAALAGLDCSVTYGASCRADAATDTLEYLTGVELPSFDGLAEAMGRMLVPAAHYAVFAHEGDPASMGTTWRAAMEQWLPASPWRDGGTPDFVVHHEDADSGDVRTELWLPVVPRR